MTDLLTKDLITYDALSEITRRERRTLLGLSILAVALVKVPLVPEKIAVLGIDLALKNQQNFLQLFAVVLLYFICAFLIYAMTDYVAWRRSKVIVHHQYTEQKIAAKISLGKQGELLLKEEINQSKDLNRDLVYSGLSSYPLAERAARIRACFDFVVPVFTGVYAIVILLRFGH